MNVMNKTHKIPESEVLKAILDTFRHDSHVDLWRRNVGGMKCDSKSGKEKYVAFGRKGMADIEGTIKDLRCPKCGGYTLGRRIEIECKGREANGKIPPLRKDQKEWLEAVRRANGVAMMIAPDPETDIIGIYNRIMTEIHAQCPNCAKRPKTTVPKGSISVDEFKRLMRQ